MWAINTSIQDISVVLPIDINQEINEKIDIFTSHMSAKNQSSQYYSKNRNTTVSKSITDIKVGKKAEYFAMYGMHQQYGMPILDIDTEIRKGRNKGWVPDLQYSDYSIHVKACSNTTYKYCKDYSWTFQLSNKNGFGGKDPILTSVDNSFTCLVFLPNYDSNIGIIKAILPTSILGQYLKDPIKRSLIGIKKCIYYKDLL